MYLANADLNYYFNNEVQMKRQTTKEAKEYVLPTVKRILEYVHKNDSRFGGDPLGAGSAFQGLKTKQADEFDFMVPLHGLPQFHWSSGNPRYYNFDRSIDTTNMNTVPDNLRVVRTSVPLPSPPTGYCFINLGSKKGASQVWRKTTDLECQQDILPFLVKKKLKQLVQQAIRCLDLREVQSAVKAVKTTNSKVVSNAGEIRLARKLSGPALTLRIPYNRNGIEEISIDMAATIPSSSPFPSHVRWPRLGKVWPSQQKISKIKALGINDTAKKPFYWLYSFALCEKEIMKEIDQDGGCRKKAHRIMKRLQEQYWRKGVNKPKISSYMLKNILLWECEKHPYSSEWQQDKLAERVESMIRFLLKSISQQRLDQYFHPDINLLSVKDEETRQSLETERLKIVEFMSNPARFLRRE